MWSRESVKDYAKDFLRKHYWKAFIVCLIATLLSGGRGDNSSNNYEDNNYNQPNIIEEVNYGREVASNSSILNIGPRRIKSPLYYITGGLLPLIIAIALILLITIGFVIEVGKNRFFLHGFRGDVRVKKVFSAFNREEYFPIVKTQLLTVIYTFLWGLLLIIPGIIKSYEYRFVAYILTEMPDLSANEVIAKSREMTKGHKMDIFVLDLSFIGWYILGTLLFGIGGFFVDPYKEATVARVYDIVSGNSDLNNENFYDNNGYKSYDIIGE